MTAPASVPLALEARGLARSYRIGLRRRARVALAGVDLELARGRTLGLVGPNGAGKSTLLRLAAGVEVPSAGTLRVLGGAPDDPRVRARLGFLPEDAPFPGELSARAALDLLGSLQGLPRRARRARGAALLERVGLAPHAGVALRRYSRGMLRRFGLAQAWLHEPALVLLDEPTAGLDAPGFDVLDGLLAEARAAGATVVLSSHLLGDLAARCDALALLVDGRLAACGAPAELLSRPGCWRFELEGLDAAGVAAAERALAAQGARVVAREPSGRTLLELYRTAAADPRAPADRAGGGS